MPGIKFTNVKTKEVVVVDTEPLISAYYNSSNLHVNATLGQDFGWRIAPELVVRIKEIRRDLALIEKIAARYSIMAENITDKDILFYISERESLEKSISEEETDYTNEYEDEIRQIEQAKKDKKAQAEEDAKAEEARAAADKKALQVATKEAKKAKEDAEKAKAEAEKITQANKVTYSKKAGSN